jgi:hypothetical protein
MSNGIDFVIGGRDQAKPAMSSVEKSLTRLGAKNRLAQKVYAQFDRKSLVRSLRLIVAVKAAWH